MDSIPKQGEIARFIAAGSAFTLSAATLLVTGACSTHGEASPDVQALTQRAQAGDMRAQLDLGMWFEERDGVPQDVGLASKLYRQAISDNGGRIWVYTPSSGNGAKGRAIPVDRGPRQAGSDDAKKRLQESASR